MMSPPGIVRGDIAVPNSIGDRYNKMPVATAEAKHFTTAFASSSVSLGQKVLKMILTFIHCSNCNAHENITDNDEEGRPTRISFEEARLCRLHESNGKVDDGIYDGSRGIQDSILGV